MKLFGLKNCDTCRKALKALTDAGADVEFHDVRVDGVTEAYLRKWMKAAGWKALLNTRSTTWRNLPETDKKDVDEAKSLKLLAEHPTLIKRPVIETEDGIHVGWSSSTQAALID